MAKLNISELDFESIKTQFKNYLKSQTQFKDYNFEGSNMSVFLDVLAYNTYQNNFYTNMAVNEMFLDSAVLKNSVMSHAKELNYLPRSRRSARALVDVVITDTSVRDQTITIPAYSDFTTSFQGQQFNFVNDVTYVARKTAPGTFVAEDVEIFEGEMLSSFEREGYFIGADGILRVILTNENADTDSIEVFVDAEATEDANKFIRKDDLFGVGPTDKVFYVEPYYDGRYTVYFGNNVFGLQPEAFEDIRVRYRITSGTEANGAEAFNLGSVSPTATIECLTKDIAQGGADRETLENIRYFAPKSLQIQERAITTNDYEILLKQNFPEIDAVAAYGGETLEPPQFGKVAISVYLGEGREGLSQVLAAAYIKFLKEKSPLGIEPIFIASEFIYACVEANVSFNTKVTKKSAGEIEANIRNTVQTYNTTYLDDFDTTLRLSKLSSNIDATDESILSNEINVCPYVVYSPALNIASSPSFKFYTKLVKPYPFKDSNGFKDYKPAVVSGAFSFNGVESYFQDDGIGNIQIVTSDVANPQIVKPIAGKVNYETGEINLVDFKVDGYKGSGIKVMATTAADDIKSPAGRIFIVLDDDVTINMVEVR
jgi:hypothetical protein|tara:strand:- start:37368 stop:39164 length:1797 start_codon:yes stop_codon:yes gene_type:complete